MPTKDNVPKLKVYISYSDADIEFVDKLVEGLERDADLELSINPDPNASKRNWKSRAGASIAKADTILFVLSPDSVQSKAFVWEVTYAHERSKRVVPILHRPLGTTTAPAELAPIKSFQFDNKGSFDGRLRSLAILLDANTDWLRMHTHLATRAHEWDDADRSVELLLIGTEITAAKKWTFERPKDAPKPTELHMMFIEASELNATAPKDGSFRPQVDLAKVAKYPALTTEKKRARRKTESTETALETKILVRQSELTKQAVEAEDERFRARPSANEAEFKNGTFDAPPILTEQQNPVQLQAEKNLSRRRQGRLQVVLGSVLLTLAAAGVWQALDDGKRAPDGTQQAMVHSRLFEEPGERLFVAPNKKIEDALTRIDCLLLQGQEEIDACIGRNE